MRTVFTLLILCWSKVLFSQELSSEITLIQGDNTYQLSFKDTVLVLKPETFRFDLRIMNSEGIFVAASTNSEYYFTPEDTVWTNWEHTSDMVAAEEENNLDKDLIEGHESFKYWFYTPDKLDWHRFDANPKIKGNTITASYTIEWIFDLEKGENVRLDKWTEPIYILFFQTTFDADRHVVFPVSRKRLAIRFAD